MHELELCGSQVGDASGVLPSDKGVAGTTITPAVNAVSSGESSSTNTKDELPW